MKGRKTTGFAAALFTAALAVAGMAVAGESPPTYDLKVAFDIPDSRIIGTATVDAPKGAKLSLWRGDLRIRSVTTGGKRVTLDPKQEDPLALRADGPVRIEFEGIVRGKEVDTIGEDAILLRDIWYPVIEGTHRYRLTATLPQDFVAVSEADRVERTEAGGQVTYSFDLPYPQRDWDGITFVASREWASRSAKYKDIDLAVHVRRRNAERLDEMMRDAQRYLGQHEEVLGPYPFKRLVIVENPVPITYSLSMFTYVLLSQRSVAAPAPEDSALNHEIAHEWFGNLVLADEGGNWAEGLATYFSDHLENERQGRAWERRQRMMNVYQHNIGDRAAFPLSGFTAADDRNARLVGYAKSAIVIHMLRRLVGDEEFLRGIRDFVTANRFRAASWTDIRHSFERATGRDLGWFFNQWVEGVAMPELALDEVRVLAAGDKHELRLTLTQQPPGSLLSVPLTVYFERGGSKTVMLQLSGERQEFHYVLDEKPVRVVLDESYDVFRRLTPAEVPPMIDTLLTRQRVSLFAPPGEEAKFRALIDALERNELPMALYGWFEERPRKGPSAASGTRFRSPPWAPPGASGTRPELRAERAAAAAAQTIGTSLILFGEDHPLIAALFDRIDLPRGGFTVTVLKHPRSPGDVVAIFTAKSKSEVDAAYRELINHPRYSSAAFDAGKLIWRELRQGQRGISSEVSVERR